MSAGKELRRELSGGDRFHERRSTDAGSAWIVETRDRGVIIRRRVYSTEQLAQEACDRINQYAYSTAHAYRVALDEEIAS